MAVFFGVGGKARKVPNLYIGVGGKARKVKAGWIGIGGKARLFYSGDNNIIGKMTDYWTGRYYDYDSSSGTNYFGHYCERSGNTSTNDINSYATIINRQMTVKARKKEVDEGFEGECAIISNAKVRLTNGQTITAKFTVQNAGSQYGTANVEIRYGTTLPVAGGKNSIFSNMTKLSDTRLQSSVTDYSATFTGTTGDYYVGVYLNGSWGSTRADTPQMAGQATLQGVTIK